MSLLRAIMMNLPEVAGPTQKKLAFKEKLKWTGMTLVLFFVLSLVPLFGLGENALQQFEYLSIILGASFGSIMSLGIGPIVTSSIVLQLLTGAGILKIEMHTSEGKKTFQGLQKILTLAFIVFEGFIYVFMGGLSPPAVLAGTPLYFQLKLILVFQLCLGGIMIVFMDEVCQKWGFGSGVSLFIAAGVSQQIFIRAFSPLPAPNNPALMTGAVPALFQSLASGDPTTAGLMFSSLFFTIFVFAICVYAQAMKIEIPLSFGRIRGHGIRWPLNFLYTSNIPVILVSALMANMQLWARLLQNWGHPILGTFVGNTPYSGLVSWLYSPDIVNKFITSSLTFNDILHAFVYMLFMVVGAVIFSIFWVQSAGMDAKSQAKNIMNSGLHMPGFRKDPRILQQILKRYIGPLTIMGGMSIGILASIADISGALSRGTGILLAVMIIYKLYENIARTHMQDMYPMLKRMMGK